MIPINREKLHAENARLYETCGRHTLEVALLAREEKHPTVPCQACSAKGTFTVHVDGTKDHSLPSAAAGDRVDPCGACKGWGFVRVSPSTKAWLDRQAVKQKRAEYRKILRAVCADRGFDAAEFNRLVAKRLKARTPEDFLRAAREVAAVFGVAA